MAKTAVENFTQNDEGLKMNFPIKTQCECGGVAIATALGSQPIPDAVCGTCGKSLHLFEPAGIEPIVNRLVGRISLEFDNGDFTLCVLLSAMTVECQTARMFYKWKAIDSGYIFVSGVPDSELSVWEEQYAQWRGVKRKLNEVCIYLTGKPFDDFVNSAGVLNEIDIQHPNFGGWQEMFKLRNRIVHSGWVDSTKEQAEAAKDYAIALVQTSLVIDRAKYDITFVGKV